MRTTDEKAIADSNVFDRITTLYYELTASEKKVADYVIVQQQKTQYMSISELAESCGVADATISRFCRQLGYKGYNAFKLAVANFTAARSVLNPASGEVLPDDSIAKIAEKLYSANVDAILQTQELISPDAILAAADILLASQQTLCMGQGGSMIMAQEAAHLFSTVYRGFYPVTDAHMQSIMATRLTKDDTVMFFSYSGYTQDLLDVLALIRSQGSKIILITRFPNSPGAALADVVLQCGSNENPLQFGSVATRMAQLYLIDIVFTEMCKRDIEGSRLNRKSVADALSNRHI